MKFSDECACCTMDIDFLCSWKITALSFKEYYRGQMQDDVSITVRSPVGATSLIKYYTSFPFAREKRRRVETYLQQHSPSLYASQYMKKIMMYDTGYSSILETLWEKKITSIYLLSTRTVAGPNDRMLPRKQVPTVYGNYSYNATKPYYIAVIFTMVHRCKCMILFLLHEVFCRRWP